MVFTLPAPISALAYTNKALVHRSLFEVAAETLLTIAADPKHLGATIGATLIAAHVGLGDDAPPHMHGIVPGGGLSADGQRWIACRRGFFLPVRVLTRLFRRRFLEELAKAHHAGVLRFFGEFAPLAQLAAFLLVRAAAHERMGRLCQAALRRPRGGARLPVALHPSGGDLEPSPGVARRRQRLLPLEGLPRQGAHPPQDDDAHCRGVHAPLPVARVAVRLSPHPALRIARQRRTAAAPSACARAARRDAARRSTHIASALEATARVDHAHRRLRVSLLWIGDARHRDLCRGATIRAPPPMGRPHDRASRPRPQPSASTRSTGLVETRSRRHAPSHHMSRCTDAAHATEGGQRFHATRRTWRSTMHIAYLRGRAALKCP